MKLMDLQVNDIFQNKDSKVNGQIIKWRVMGKDVATNSVTLVTDEVYLYKKNNSLQYFGSIVDTYINTTFYNSLSNFIKSNTVQKNITNNYNGSGIRNAYLMSLNEWSSIAKRTYALSTSPLYLDPSEPSYTYLSLTRDVSTNYPSTIKTFNVSTGVHSDNGYGQTNNYALLPVINLKGDIFVSNVSGSIYTNIEIKYLLQTPTNDLFTVNGGLVNLNTQTPTEALYLASGFSDITLLNGTTFNQTKTMIDEGVVGTGKMFSIEIDTSMIKSVNVT